MKKQRRKIRQINSHTTYWDHVLSEQTESKEQHIFEPVKANPDSLINSLDNKPWGNNTPILAKILIDEYMNEEGDFPILSKQENVVLRLYTSGHTLGQIALELNPPISKSSVVTYLKRISIKFRKLLKPLESEL